ncbi:hypothetical protein HIM_08042 [Hirsutella minnesotensis 3608]|uniref:Glycine cleavage system P protein n=1 Tax=Hirsutella minnesotensis 3608 TaxID=1043627 RepID=A0A0F7ZT54_9HYPO|nr:hypothetical protein HIM_08042 [Hirsutella minnesotensis 3608]
MVLARGLACRRAPVLPSRLATRGACARLGARWYSAQSEAAEETPTPTEPASEKEVKLTQKVHQSLSRQVFEKMREATNKEPPKWKNFQIRHIGPRDGDVPAMLKALGSGAEDMESFISQVIPDDVRLPPKKPIQARVLSEYSIGKNFEKTHAENRIQFWMNGGGFYPVETPGVIKRNILENPGWYTSYTPYQAEISQGRLESLLNYQTMVSDLTGLPVSNASLLDEGTAAAEAMTMSLNQLSTSRAKRPGKTYVVSDLIHFATFEVMQGRAEGFGIKIVKEDLSAPDALDKIRAYGDDLIGVLVQYPDTQGGVQDFRELAEVVHQAGVLLSAATDLSALTILTPPGEWGADIAFGNSQRFGVPLGYGGPHAAFMATRESLKRRLPGRLVGVSKDRLGNPALRLALQTREQHIRREKATSNVCTAQALLANMAAMYAIYHGPNMLRDMAVRNLRWARALQAAARYYGLEVTTRTLDAQGQVLSDTITIRCAEETASISLRSNLHTCGIGYGRSADVRDIVLAVPTNFNNEPFMQILKCFKLVATKNRHRSSVEVASNVVCAAFKPSSDEVLAAMPEAARRQSSFLTHPVFNTHHSETELLRYIHHLQSKDLSLVHSMIPLGSCTMKLNATYQMELVTSPKASNIHPLNTLKHTPGWRTTLGWLGKQLTAMTGMDAVSVQPNSGAQGEFAGLRTIRKYLEQQPGEKRDICLIPVSAHGTNPASAIMAGMRVVPIKCDSQTGNLDLEDLTAKCKEHASQLGAIMITYPSTYGVFEPNIRKVCDIVHEHGGQVYMDGANMNAQIGLTNPGDLGADVCHLNLHKTFCIPHGGGGPGVGPICVKAHLEEYLPHKLGQTPVSTSFLGSASILPISYAYITAMGDEGLVNATKMALLNANYILARLKDHYPILYTNSEGRCAHEFIIDARPFKATSGIEAIDIAKRLQDYGFHAPTMSWPVPNTLMIEPTESESKAELDRFIDAMISIRQEIRDVEEGKQPREGNVLKMSPHTQVDLISGDGDGKWERPYSREVAAYPLPWLKEKKFWPTVTRVDDTHGDTNLFCTCPPVQDTTSD